MLLGRQSLMPGVLEDTQSTWVAPFLLHSSKECLKCRQGCGNALAQPVGGQAVILPGLQKGGEIYHPKSWPEETAPELLGESTNFVITAFTKELKQKPASQAQGQQCFQTQLTLPRALLCALNVHFSRLRGWSTSLIGTD